MEDQFGWEYSGGKYIELGGLIGQLMPGEAMRFDLKFRQISKLSRPVALKYAGLTMDVSTWT